MKIKEYYYNGYFIFRWTKLEEQLVAEAQGSLPMIFKPALQLYTNFTNNSTRPIGIVGGSLLIYVNLNLRMLI